MVNSARTFRISNVIQSACLGVIACAAAMASVFIPSASHAQPAESTPQFIRTPAACPATPESLSALMLRDLPNYTNRVLQSTNAVLPRSQDPIEQPENTQIGSLLRQPYRPSYVLIASQANLAPLPLDAYTYTTSPDDGGELVQVFFTTLSRLYNNLQTEEIQEYHWAFLTPTENGWRLAFLFSAIDDPQVGTASLPPRENSQGSVGQAIRTWLRDCRAGAISR